MAQTDNPLNGNTIPLAPMKSLAIVGMVGPSFVWAAEYIGSGEVILATRTGAILGTAVLWAVVLAVFLKCWIGMSAARYTVCTGEGLIDMFDRMPGPRHWAVWIVLIAQFIGATSSIGALATAAGVFVSSLIPQPYACNAVDALLPGRVSPENFNKAFPVVCGWVATFFAVSVVWSGKFGILKKVMSGFVLIIVLGVMYVALYVLPPVPDLLRSFTFRVPAVPEWALTIQGITSNPWKELLPLLGWSAGGFASQVWYTYWVIGAGYGATAGRGYGKAADVSALRRMSRDTAQKIKGWCRVLYTDSSVAMVIGIVVITSFMIAGAGVLGPKHTAPSGPKVALELSNIFSSKWGTVGGFLFVLAGAAALVSTQVGQLAGWPRLLADAFRICIPGFNKRLAWKWQFRLFLIFFLCTNMILVCFFRERCVKLVQISAILDGLLLTPLQALGVAIGLYVVMPRILPKEAAQVLKPNWVFAAILGIAFLVFGYYCVFQIPSALAGFK